MIYRLDTYKVELGFFGHPEVIYIGFVTSLYTEIIAINEILLKSIFDYIEYIMFIFNYNHFYDDQSVGNSHLAMLINGKVTSETIREEYKKEVSNYNFKNKPSNFIEWGQYLAGVFEGDGYFNVNHGVTITFHAKDKSSAHKLAKWFGHGHVNPIKNKNAVNWVITNNEGVKKFLSYINGHIHTEDKLNQILYNTTNKFAPNNLGINFKTAKSPGRSRVTCAVRKAPYY